MKVKALNNSYPTWTLVIILCKLKINHINTAVDKDHSLKEVGFNN